MKNEVEQDYYFIVSIDESKVHMIKWIIETAANVIAPWVDLITGELVYAQNAYGSIPNFVGVTGLFFRAKARLEEIVSQLFSWLQQF